MLMRHHFPVVAPLHNERLVQKRDRQPENTHSSSSNFVVYACDVVRAIEELGHIYSSIIEGHNYRINPLPLTYIDQLWNFIN